MSEEEISKLKEFTVLDLAQKIEADLIHAGVVSGEMSVYEYITKYFME